MGHSFDNVILDDLEDNVAQNLCRARASLASRPTVGDIYSILTTAALVAAVARSDYAASIIWQHLRYQSMTNGRPGWPALWTRAY